MSQYFEHNGETYVLRRDLNYRQAQAAAYFGFDDKLVFSIHELDGLESAFELESDIALQMTVRPEDFKWTHVFVDDNCDGVNNYILVNDGGAYRVYRHVKTLFFEEKRFTDVAKIADNLSVPHDLAQEVVGMNARHYKSYAYDTITDCAYTLINGKAEACETFHAEFESNHFGL